MPEQVQVPLRCPPDLADELTRAAGARGVSRNQLMNELLRVGLENGSGPDGALEDRVGDLEGRVVRLEGVAGL
jgi:hypothetical protein